MRRLFNCYDMQGRCWRMTGASVKVSIVRRFQVLSIISRVDLTIFTNQLMSVLRIFTPKSIPDPCHEKESIPIVSNHDILLWGCLGLWV